MQDGSSRTPCHDDHSDGRSDSALVEAAARMPPVACADEARGVSLLMADLGGFAAFCGTASPSRVSAAINECLVAMVQIVVAHRGRVRDVTADGLLAAFGARAGDPEQTSHAAQAALEMRAAISRVGARWGLEPGLGQALGIAIHDGRALGAMAGVGRDASKAAPRGTGAARPDPISSGPRPGGAPGEIFDESGSIQRSSERRAGERDHIRQERDTDPAIRITRRLAAIAFADVVGWSRLIEQNDVETLRAWKALRSDLIEPKIHEHGGRLLEIAGDAVLVEFESAVAAVEWARDVQRELSSQAGDEGEARLHLRISINVEDVIVDDDRLIGDGVNIAARILPLASPGEIVVTAAVRDYIWNKMAVTFGDLGERELRNISRPIRVYRIDSRDPGAGIPVRSQPYLSWTRRPAVAVLPFRNLGGNREEGYFGDGITEDIISGLSRSHSLYVIAWNSTLRYRDRPVDARDVAAELGVRYILEGSVRRQASRLRIAAELVDATSSRTVWAEKFDGADQDIFEFQDRITASIVGALEPRLYQAEAARALGKPTESLDAYECVLRALSRLYTFNDRDFAEAGRYLERAVSLDPLYAQAHAYLAWWFNLLRGEGRSIDPLGDVAKAVRAASTAVEIDPDDAFCLAVAGHVQGFVNKNLDAAVDMFDRALRQNENCAFAWGLSGPTYCFLGRPDEALARLRNAWRLSPFDPLNFFFWTVAGIAEFVAGRYDQAIGWLRKAERMNRRFAACHRTLTASLALSGDLDGARAAAENLLAVEPRFQVSTFASWYPLRRRDDLDRLVRGLSLAGLPE